MNDQIENRAEKSWTGKIIFLSLKIIILIVPAICVLFAIIFSLTFGGMGLRFYSDDIARALWWCEVKRIEHPSGVYLECPPDSFKRIMHILIEEEEANDENNGQ